MPPSHPAQSLLSRRRLMAAGTACLGVCLGGRAYGAQESNPGPGAPPALLEYARDPVIFETALSPDGGRVALMSQIDGRKVLFDYDLATGAAKRYPVGDVKVRSLFWAGNGHICVVTSRTTDLPYSQDVRREYSQAHILDLDSGRYWQLYDRKPGYYTTLFRWPRTVLVDGRYGIMCANYNTAAETVTLDLHDLESRGMTTLDAGRQVDDWLFGPDGRLLARSEQVSSSGRWTLQSRVDQDWHELYAEITKGATPEFVAEGAEDGFILASRNGDGNEAQYFLIAPDGAMAPPLKTPGKSPFALTHPTTWRHAGLGDDGDWVSYDYADPDLKTLDQKVAAAFPGYRYRIESMAREDPRRMIVYSEGADDAGSYYYIDFGTKAVKEVGKAYPGIPEVWLTEKTKISYEAADGTAIDAFLTLPIHREAKALPLIVLPHGGPQARDTLAFDWEGQAYASRGYAVLQPNYRGSSGYGAAFVEAGYGQWGKKMQTDLSDGVRHLAAQGIIDLARVAIVGASYGGYAALAGAAFDPDVYRCAVATAAVTDLPDFRHNRALRDLDGDNQSVSYWNNFWGDDTDIEAISPARHADRIKIPVLVIHGTDDTVVPFSQSEKMVRGLRAANGTVEFVRLENEDHWLSREATRLKMLESSFDFLNRYNPA